MRRGGDTLRLEQLRHEGLSGAALLAIAVGYLWIASHYSTDALANPGPGIFPRLAGTLLTGLASLQLVHSVWRFHRASPKVVTPIDRPDEAGQRGRANRSPLWMVGALAVYLLLMPRLGFSLATFALTLVSCKLMGTRGWRVPLALASGLVLACRAVFVVWLRVPLPTGFLG